MYIYELALEVTRRCQFECAHCLRGDVQKVDMSEEILETLFSQVDEVGSLLITGGEPSLYDLSKILYSLKINNVIVDNFYIATNGHTISADFVVNCMKLYDYCEHVNTTSRVDLSNDAYHQDMIYNPETELLGTLSWFGNKNEDGDRYTPIRMGRAAEQFSEENTREPEEIRDVTTKEEFNEDLVYISAKGGVSFGCNHSFDLIDENRVCEVKDLFNYYEGLECEDQSIYRSDWLW